MALCAGEPRWHCPCSSQQEAASGRQVEEQAYKVTLSQSLRHPLPPGTMLVCTGCANTARVWLWRGGLQEHCLYKILSSMEVTWPSPAGCSQGAFRAEERCEQDQRSGGNEQLPSKKMSNSKFTEGYRENVETLK